MRLIAVSIVKNEADVIEAFVRHTVAWVDHQLIFDHASTDGTRQILQSLVAEGLPLSLYTDDALANLQQWRSNQLTRLAAGEFAADWILPLDADEILSGPGRTGLERRLQAFDPGLPASLPLLDYYPTAQDNAVDSNPATRLRHCHARPSRTQKVMVPRALAQDPTAAAGKGSHAVYRHGVPLSAQPLPPEYHLAHLALRSPQHQVIRVVLAELQKLSRGQAAAGLDVHYRLGYQLLAENPDLFFATVCTPAEQLRQLPIVYRGAPLRYTSGQGWNRVARALLPYLEQLATSHGRLLDESLPRADVTAAGEPPLRLLTGSDLRTSDTTAAAFQGFDAQTGWGPPEGPVPEAFLPIFHWGMAPASVLTVNAASVQLASFTAECLTYVEHQNLSLELNGTPLLRHSFGRVNQKESLAATLSLRAGANELVLRYSQSLQSAADPRALAVIFLSLRIRTI